MFGFLFGEAEAAFGVVSGSEAVEAFAEGEDGIGVGFLAHGGFEEAEFDEVLGGTGKVGVGGVGVFEEFGGVVAKQSGLISKSKEISNGSQKILFSG